MLYTALKHIHMLCALISLLGFLVRSTWAFQGSALLEKKFVRIAPHIVDTLFLASAIGLVIVTGFYPIEHAWINVKLIGLVLYIVLGFFTLKKAENNIQRGIFFALAIVIYGYIMLVARTKNPMFFTAMLGS